MSGRRFYLAADIRRHYEEGPGHFFDRATMRFLGSRLLEPCFEGPGGVYFCTSEYRGFGDKTRRYSVRLYIPETRRILSLDLFGAFLTAKRAKADAKARAERTSDA